jgi:hypothetical protein
MMPLAQDSPASPGDFTSDENRAYFAKYVTDMVEFERGRVRGRYSLYGVADRLVVHLPSGAWRCGRQYGDDAVDFEMAVSGSDRETATAAVLRIVGRNGNGHHLVADRSANAEAPHGAAGADNDREREGASPTAEALAAPPKPVVLAPDVNKIPENFRAIPAWVGWRMVWVERKNEKPGRWTKVPIDIRTGGLAEADNPATWIDFQTAVANYQRLGCDGIGLCRTGDLVFVDLDGCLDADGGVLSCFSWAAKILAVLKGRAYVEISPSGRGIHAICRGKLPPGRRQFDEPDLDHTGFAFYDANRYFTFTGSRFQASGPIEEEEA